ncbi:MAG: PAS domain-containing protein, partial [Pseudomonadota bacterium]
MSRPEQTARRRWADLAEDLAGVGYWWMDATGHGLRLSPSLFSIFGFEDGAAPTLEDVLARIHPADQDAVDEALRQVLSGRASGWSARVIRPSGEVRHVEGRNDVQIGSQGLAKIGDSALTHERLIAAYRQTMAVKALVADAEKRLVAYVDDHGPIDLGNGSVYGRYTRKGNEELDGSI